MHVLTQRLMKYENELDGLKEKLNIKKIEIFHLENDIKEIQTMIELIQSTIKTE